MVQTECALIDKQLFGGAISIKLPYNIFDISKVRDVPDHQEVFAHPTNDQSVMIEILEYSDLEDTQAPEHYFRDLAEANQSAQSCVINNIVKLDDITIPNCDSIWYLDGVQLISKYHETVANTVNINMALYRFKQFQSDILIIFNDPVIINPSSSSYSDPSANSPNWTKEHFLQITHTLSIHDFSLFGH